MNDDELDRTIRFGLASMIDQAHEPAPFPSDPAPGSDVPARMPRRRGNDTRRVRYLSIAAALVLGVVGLCVWTISDDGQGGIEAVQDAPDEPSGFAGWEPGWHTLDPGPVPAMNGAQITWTGKRLIISGHRLSSDGTTVAEIFSYDPATREWTELPRPPRDTNRIVAAGDTLVVVGFDDEYPVKPVNEWATLAPGADEWTSHGAVPQSAVLAEAGVTGIGAGRDQLVWTGARVFDVGRGAVLNPASGDAAELPMPADVVAYTQLLSATPVWTGEQVVLSSWSTGPGLAWDATGIGWQDVPGPVVDGWPPSSGSAAAAAPLGSDVVVVSEGAEDVGYSASLDPTRGEWTRLSDVPGPSNTTCPYRLTAVGDTPIVQPCTTDYGTPLRLVGDTWSEIGSPPFTEGTWIGTDQALIMWSTDVDTLNNPRAPYVEAAVWIPPSKPDSSDPPDANSPNAAPGSDSTSQPSSSPVQSDTGVRYQELGELAPNSAPSTTPIAATNQAELNEMWSQLGQPAATKPDIDFDNDIVIAATAPGNGCRSELTRIELREEQLTVMLTSPDRVCTRPLLLWTTVLAIERDQLPASFVVAVPTQSDSGYSDAYLAVELN